MMTEGFFTTDRYCPLCDAKIRAFKMLKARTDDQKMKCPYCLGWFKPENMELDRIA